jgi:hypothetical protein
MASAETVRLVVKDWHGIETMTEVVPDEEIQGIVDGAKIFKIMNSRCGLALWQTAIMATRGGRRDTVYAGVTREAGIVRSIQRNLDRVRSTPSTEPCVFTLEVRKKREVLRGDGAGGPESARHPGIGPLHGPDYGGFDTPAGPKSLARMRGMLARA